MSANKVEYGLENVHIAFITDGETPTWDTPVEIPGAVSFSASPEGDVAEFYADNVKYYIHESNNGYTGELEIANIPDTVLAEMLGLLTDDNGMLVESAEDSPKEFALMFEVKGDAKNRRTVFYRCKPGRLEDNASTMEGSIDPNTKSIPLTVLPIETDDKYIKAVMELSETNGTEYDAFFDAVTEPTVAAT